MDLTRQQDLLNNNVLAQIRILIIGAGGIGSFTTASLAKMGIEYIQVWDKDTIEEYNIPNQNYSPEQAHSIKVEALRGNILRDTQTLIDTKNDYWYGDFSYDPDIIISAVDSMTIRYNLWEHIKKYNSNKKVWLLDARMSSRSMSLFNVLLNDEISVSKYEKNALFPSEEAIKEPCTAKAIIHTSLACAYVICNTVHNIINGLPISTSYHGDLLNVSLMKENSVIQ